MGYRSEVAIALTGNGVEALKSKLAETDKHMKSEVELLLKDADRHYSDSETGSEVWQWEGIKWYGDDPNYYPEIWFIQQFLDALDEDEFRFIRIGEDYDDTEVFGWFTENPFDLELARGITIQPSMSLPA